MSARGALVAVVSLFFLWGFITCMNDILIPHLKTLFELSYLQAMLVQFAFFGAYFVGSLAYFLVSYYHRDPIGRMGYKGGMISGLALAAFGCALFYPAEVTARYEMFLAALFVLGLGFTLLQISTNPYVAILGRPEHASARLNLAQGFNSLGTTLAPIIGGMLFFGSALGGAALDPVDTHSPYLVFALLFLSLAIVIWRISLPEIRVEATAAGQLGALGFPQLRFGILAIFFYVGAEVGIGSLLINFLKQDEVAGFTELVGKNYLALYWGGAMIGRFIGSIALRDGVSRVKNAPFMILAAAVVLTLVYLIIDIPWSDMLVFGAFVLLSLVCFLFAAGSSAKNLTLFAVVNIALIMVTLIVEGPYAYWPLVAVGLFNSIMWSNIFTMAIAGLGKFTSQGSSLLIMGILGAALLPLLQGYIADAVTVKASFIIPGLCYLFLVFYGWRFRYR